jgi:hypothetical protein
MQRMPVILAAEEFKILGGRVEWPLRKHIHIFAVNKALNAVTYM